MNQLTGFLDINRYAEGETVVKTVLSVLEDYRDSFEDTELGKINKTKVNSVLKKVKEAGYANADIKKVSTTKGINEFLSQKAIYSSKQSVRGTIQSVLGTASKNHSADLGAFWEQAKKAKNIEYKNLRWGKYGGRVLSDVYLDRKLYSNLIIEKGLARPYDGGTKHGWCK